MITCSVPKQWPRADMPWHRNRRRNQWVGWCVSSWWPLFPFQKLCVNIYIYIYEFGVLQSLTSQDVSVPGPSFRISDSTWCHRTPLSHIQLLNLDILQGSFRLCNWLSLRRLVSWINHLPPACWSTFWKSILNTSWAVGLPYWIVYLHFLYFDICNYICLNTSYHLLALSLLFKYSLFFQVLLYYYLP